MDFNQIGCLAHTSMPRARAAALHTFRGKQVAYQRRLLPHLQQLQVRKSCRSLNGIITHFSCIADTHVGDWTRTKLHLTLLSHPNKLGIGTWYPDWERTNTCAQDGLQPSWMSGTYLFSSRESCCSAYFSWQASCLSLAAPPPSPPVAPPPSPPVAPPPPTPTFAPGKKVTRIAQ
jgi:hypothetical protein